MNNQRRNVLKSGSGAALLTVLAAAGIIKPGMALAEWNKAAFDAKSMADTLKAMGVGTPADSKEVQVTGPDIAENGADQRTGDQRTVELKFIKHRLHTRNTRDDEHQHNLKKGNLHCTSPVD